MIILPITLTIAGAAALLNLWLGQRVGKMRVAHKVSIGDGGNEPLLTRMRAQANFVEYTPFFLILLGLIELATGSHLWLWIVAILYILGRIIHMFGMDQPPPSRLRMVGIIVTMLTLLGLACYAIAIPYLERWKPATITYASAGAPAATLSVIPKPPSVIPAKAGAEDDRRSIQSGPVRMVGV